MNQKVLEEKKNVVHQVSDLLAENSTVVVCEYRGLSVKEVSELRKKLRESGAHATVYKNALVARASEKYEGFDKLLTGPNMFVFVKDATDGSLKSLAKFAKTNENLNIKGGIVDGEVKDAKFIKELASIPSKEVLLSMLVSVLQAPLRNLAYDLSQVASSK